MKVQAYLSFDGRTEEAFEFYRTALGAEMTMLMRFKDCPVPLDPNMVRPGTENKIMHMQFQIGETVIMASDGRCQGEAKFQGVSLSLTVPTDAEAQQRFAALAAGGSVHMPLAKTFFASLFGIVADKFGVQWMVLVGQ
jgi:PhnB protein